jgi:hypothetical protein
MAKYPDEILADFQETYHLNLWAEPLGDDWRDRASLNTQRIAALAWQLPNTSRVWRRVSPGNGNTVESQLLRQVEHAIQMFRWSFSKDAKTKSNVPEPLTLPGETEAKERAEERADSMALSLAQEFGLKL